MPDNDLTVLPAAIANLINLRELDVSKNSKQVTTYFTICLCFSSEMSLRVQVFLTGCLNESFKTVHQITLLRPENWPQPQAQWPVKFESVTVPVVLVLSRLLSTPIGERKSKKMKMKLPGKSCINDTVFSVLQIYPVVRCYSIFHLPRYFTRLRDSKSLMWWIKEVDKPGPVTH